MKKNLMVFFLTIIGALFLVATVSANPIAGINSVTIDGVEALGNDSSIVAGETIAIKVYFEALEDASDVRIEAEIEGDKVDTDARAGPFDVEDGHNYRKVIDIQVPQELKDQVSETATLVIKIWNSEHKTEIERTLRIQRPSYDVDVMSISTQSTIDAGETFPVDVVVKNVGYNDLDDLYVTVSIPALEIERQVYFGDLIAVECDEDFGNLENYGVNLDRKCNEDDEDTVAGRIYLEVPYDAKSGIYALEVEVENSDMTVSETKQITIQNDFSAGNVIVEDATKMVGVGATAQYVLHIANPTDNLKFYRVVTQSSGSVSTNAEPVVVGVAAGSSKAVTINAVANAKGEYTFSVNVFSGEELVDTVNLSLKAEGTTVSNPIVVLTVILAIVFLVLLIVLIILLGKKPEKTEEFGESYY